MPAGITNEEIAPEDVEAEEVRATDLLVVAAKAEEEAASLEVWLFEEADEEGERHAYVHHDIPLPAFPLSVTWMRFNPADNATPGSFAAISTMDPEIEIWDLDAADVLEPAMVLGGATQSARSAAPEAAGSSGGKKAKNKLKKGSHKSSVLSLAWNATVQNVLASGSADKTIKLWDLATGACETTLSHHSNKVQALAWNPQEASVLLSGSFGGGVCVCDTRAGDAAVATWDVTHDVEDVAWGQTAAMGTKFAVSRDDGHVLCFDTRSGANGPPVFTLSAHDEAATSVTFSPAVPDIMYSCSVDKTVKVWSTKGDAPKLLKSQDVNVGAVLCMSVPKDVPQLVVAGGAKGEITAWDTSLCPELAQLLTPAQ